MNNRKKRTTVNRDISEDWTDTELLKLKKIADIIIEKLYPESIKAIVETADIAGSYLNQNMPFSPTAARPYLEWCMHKYPPYSLSVDSSLLTKTFQRHSKVDGSTFVKKITLPMKGDFAKNLIVALHSIYGGTIDNPAKPVSKLIQAEVSTLDYLEQIIDSFFLSEDKESSTQYNKNRLDLISYRKDKLKTDLEIIDQELLLLQDQAGIEKLSAIFDTFFSQFPIPASENSDTCKSVIKYRFFAHIITLFLKVAGSKNHNYTPARIKKYQETIKGSKDDPYTSVRHRIENTDAHNTPPNAEELKVIKKFSNKLFSLLNGRTDKYDLLVYLDQLKNPNKGDFPVDGRIRTKKDLEIRSFIKSLTMFFCLYHYDRLSAYSMALTQQELNIEFDSMTNDITQLTKQITDIFFYDVTITLIKTNAKDIYVNIQELIIGNIKMYDIPISKSTEEARQFAQQVQFTKEANHSHPKLLNYIKNKHDASSSTESRKQWCNELQITTSGSFFWSDVFEYHSEVAGAVGTVKLDKLESPRLSKDDLDAQLLRAISFIKQHKKALLSGQYYPWQ